MAESDRKSVQIPPRTHAILRAFVYHHSLQCDDDVDKDEEKHSIGSMVAITVDAYVQQEHAQGQWVPSKRDLRRKP